MFNSYAVGTITDKPTLRTTQTGKQITTFTLECVDGDYTTWVRCKAWNQRADEALSLRIGQQLFVEGRPQPESWTDKQTGEAKAKQCINLSRWLVLGEVRQQRRQAASAWDDFDASQAGSWETAGLSPGE